MTIGSLDSARFIECVARCGATIEIGPFGLTLRSDVAQVGRLVHDLYADYPIREEAGFVDFRVAVMRARGPRRWLRPYAEFSTDGDHPFSPMPIGNAFPLLEWGFNWCVATTAHQFLMLHAGVVEKDGAAVLMPALPGSGKSTLCAALTSRGWRLLSDEFALIRPRGIEVTPFPRCIPLKNESIDVIRSFAPEAILGPTFFGTRKGDVAHLRPPRESVRRMRECASLTHLIFPHFSAGRPLAFTPIPKARAFMKLASNSFNYELFGADGFHTVGDIIDACECLAVEYSNLDEAVSAFDALRPRVS